MKTNPHATLTFGNDSSGNSLTARTSGGGSDQPENGLWLCEYHHRSTEGKLKGKRFKGAITVRLIKST